MPLQMEEWLLARARVGEKFQYSRPATEVEVPPRPGRWGDNVAIRWLTEASFTSIRCFHGQKEAPEEGCQRM